MVTMKWEGNFVKKLDERLAGWASNSPKMHSIIMVPEELAWWYYHEYGTGIHNTKSEGVHGKYELPTEHTGVEFTGDTGKVRRPFVMHPGVPATRSVTTVATSLAAMAAEDLPGFFASVDFMPDKMKVIFSNTFMQRVKDEICDELARNLPGSGIQQENPKLGGASASETFRALSDIVTVEG